MRQAAVPAQLLMGSGDIHLTYAYNKVGVESVAIWHGDSGVLIPNPYPIYRIGYRILKGPARSDPVMPYTEAGVV